MTEGSANLWFNIANGVVIFAGLLALAGSTGVWYFSSVKEQLSDKRFEQVIGPRTLSEDAVRKLQNALIGEQQPVCIVSFGGPEPTQFADALFVALSNVRLIGENDGTIHRVVSEVVTNIIGLNVYTPASLAVKGMDDDSLVRALRSAGLEVNGWGSGPQPHLGFPPSTPIKLKPTERIIYVGEKSSSRTKAP